MKTGRTTAVRLALACVLLFPPVIMAQGGQAAVSLSFGIVPQQSAGKLAGLWTPILTYLSRKTGYAIHFKTARDIPTFERRLAAGDYDLAYMNPYHYTVFSRRPGYRVFAAEKGRIAPRVGQQRLVGGASVARTTISLEPHVEQLARPCVE